MEAVPKVTTKIIHNKYINSGSTYWKLTWAHLKCTFRDRIWVSKVLKISGSPWKLCLRTLEIITSMQKYYT